LKPNRERGSFDAKVIFNGKNLQFPGWEERKCIEQARYQANWLSRWGSSAIGEDVRAKPVLALPGWFIDQKCPCEVIIYNGKNPKAWAFVQKEVSFSDQLIQRISHQLDQRCRDVAPIGYKREKK